MNPQQFQNMGGMGRGMQMGNMQQMNQAFQMNAQMPNQMGGQMGMTMQPQMGQQMNVAHPQMQKYIFQNLQNQGTFNGWQANVSIQERAAQVKQLVDSLRLVRPPVELPRAVEVALQFERKCFSQSASKEDYFRDCSEKLGRIRDQRAQQMNQQAAGVMQQPGMPMSTPNQNFLQMQQMNPNMNQNMPNGMSVPAHMQQQMQASPMFGQQQRTPQVMMNQNQMMQNQAMLQNQMTQQQRQNQFGELSNEDNKAINLRAAELAKSTPKDEMRNIVEKMNPQLRASLTQKAIDPIIYYFRMLATREFRKRKSMEAGGNLNQMGNMNQTPNQQQGQAQAGMQNPPFMNDMGRFQGLQAEGLRSQETGELVVPASNSQGVVPDHIRLQQQMLANQQRMGQQNQANAMNPNFLAQQQRLQQVQGQQNKMQQQLQAQSQQQARAQAAAQAISGQPGQNQGVSQSNTPLSMLNRPVQNVKETSPQSLSRPASRAPMPGQQQQMGVPMQNNPQLNMQAALSRFPPQIQNILRQKPQSEWQSVLQEFGPNSMRRSASQQPPGLQQQQQQQLQQQQPQHQPQQQSTQLQNGAFLGGTNIGPSPMQQSLSAGAVGVQGKDMSSMMPGTPQQGQLQPNQDLLRQRQAQLQQQQQQRAQGDQPGNAGPQGQQIQTRPLNAAEMKAMDQQQVHPNILNNIRQHTRLPDIKTWAQLKTWALSNPIPSLSMPNLMNIQATHFAHMMRARKAVAGNMPPASMPAQMQQQQQQQPPQIQQQSLPQNQPRPQQQIQNVQGQNTAMPPGQPQLKPPSIQDIQRIRSVNPKLQNMSDDQVRTLLMSRQKQLLQQQAMQQQAAQQAQGQQMPFMPQGQPNQQVQQQQPPPSANQQAQQPPRPQSVQATQAKQQQQPPSQPEKGIKRGNDEEPIEVPNPAQTAPKPSQLELGKGPPQLTREQFNALDPIKKQQYMKYQRQQSAMKRIFELTKEVQGTMSKLRLLNLDAASRRRIMALLTSDNVKNMLGRFDQFLLAYYQMENNEAEVKKLIHHRLQLFPQYKPESLANKTFIPVENPTINAETVEGIINNITAKFQQTAAQIPKTQPTQTTGLTTENLSRLEAQEQERKKSVSKGSGAPPAPTTTQPPFQLGDPRGQGTPRYGAPGLKQEDLKLPADPKRRKKNPPGVQTPTAGQTVTTPQTTSPQQAKPTLPVQMAFKCSNEKCEFHVKGFATQAELDVHTRTAHEPVIEHIADPIAFLNDSLRVAFNLDENFKQIKKSQPIAAAPMEKTISKASVATNLKIESKPATPVPMMKVLSQAGITSSPATAKNQATNKDTTSSIRDAGHTNNDEDPWKHSNITLEELSTAVGDIDWIDVVPASTALTLQDDFLRAYQNSEEWQKIIKGPEGDLTDTSTEKSKSPPLADDTQQSGGKPKEDVKAEDDLFIDLTSIDGLNISAEDVANLEKIDFSDINNTSNDDVKMENGGSSPFEIIEKPKFTEEEQVLIDYGIDLTNPESLTDSQKMVMKVWLDPFSDEAGAAGAAKKDELLSPSFDPNWDPLAWYTE